jgi:hypothetical protein
MQFNAIKSPVNVAGKIQTSALSLNGSANWSTETFSISMDCSENDDHRSLRSSSRLCSRSMIRIGGLSFATIDGADLAPAFFPGWSHPVTDSTKQKSATKPYGRRNGEFFCMRKREQSLGRGDSAKRFGTV